MIPETMCAALLKGHGGPEKLVYSRDVPVPDPAAGEVLVEVSACGVNNSDIWVREGAYGSQDDAGAVSSFSPSLEFPRIQGADIVGHIADVGDGVPETRIGERVMVDFSIYNGDGDSLAEVDYIGHGRDGGFADFTTVPADQAHPVQSEMTDVELATFCADYMTGERMLNRANVRAGERVLVTGASGGVGSAVIQLCRARGAVPSAVTSAGKEDAVRAIGADTVLLRSQATPLCIITESTVELFDVVVDVVAGPLFNDLLRLVKPEGRYVTCGAMAGPVVQFDLRTLYLKQLQLHGSSQGTRSDFRRVLDYIEGGRLKAMVGGIYKLSDIHRAQTDFKRKQFVGNLVLVPDSKWIEQG